MSLINKFIESIKEFSKDLWNCDLDEYWEEDTRRLFERAVFEDIILDEDVIVYDATHRYNKPVPYKTYSVSFDMPTGSFNVMHIKAKQLCDEYNKTLIHFGTETNPRISKLGFMILRMEWK